MIWWERAGLTLEAVGLGLAIWGLFMTYREAVGRRLDVDLRSRIMQSVRRMLPGRPSSQVVTGAGTATLTVTAEGVGIALPARPGESATVEERLAYLTSSVDSLRQETAAVEERATSLVAAYETRANSRMDQMTARQESTDERVLTLEAAFVGRNGSGLQWAAVGLAFTLVGVLLSIVGTL